MGGGLREEKKVIHGSENHFKPSDTDCQKGLPVSNDGHLLWVADSRSGWPRGSAAKTGPHLSEPSLASDLGQIEEP